MLFFLLANNKLFVLELNQLSNGFYVATVTNKTFFDTFKQTINHFKIKMNKLLCIIFVFIFQCNYSQNIGLRANFDVSETKKITPSFGGGLYLNLTDFSKKIEFILSVDFLANKKNIHFQNDPYNGGMVTDYNKYVLSVASFYVIPIKDKIKTKIGSILNYNAIIAHDNYYPSNTIDSYKAQYIGVGLIANLQFQKIAKTSFNVDIFITPTYLIKINYESNPTKINPDYSKNGLLLNTQLGISYNLFKK